MSCLKHRVPFTLVYSKSQTDCFSTLTQSGSKSVLLPKLKPNRYEVYEIKGASQRAHKGTGTMATKSKKKLKKVEEEK